MEIVTKYGYIVGIFVSRIPDSDDPDRYPDVISASIVPTITRVVNAENLPLVSPSHGASGVFMKTVEFPCALMSDGHLTGDIASPGVASPDAVPGMWLPIGLYKISLLGHAPDIEFLVEERHTQESPLDLYQYAKFVSDPSAPIQVVEVPTGGLPNQALAWSTSGLTWYEPPVNELTIGAVTEGPASATISGDAPQQVLDLTIPRGLTGPANSLSIGTVVEGPASADITGQAPNQTLNLSIPKGNTGATPTLASGSVTKVAAGGNPTAAVRRNGTTDQYFLDLGLVTGADGSPTAYDKRGTGMPNGVVTGNPGDTYTDTAGTNGAWKWRKASGTGNTGWVVVDGDTGWRALTPLVTITAGSIVIRRVNSLVTLASYSAAKYPAGITFDATVSLSTRYNIAEIPVGFQPENYVYGRGGHKGASISDVYVIRDATQTTKLSYQVASFRDWNAFSLVYDTREAWPATLPGTAV